MNTQRITEPPPDIGELRSCLHGMWAAVAEAWGEHAEYIDARHASVRDRMLDLTTPRPGQRVLELACGAGGLGLVAAVRVAPDGEVVQSDVVAEMTEIAAARARTLGITNVRTRVLDLEHIAEPDCSYDVVLCSEGLMFVPEPARSAREIQRVLRPGGRVALTVWGPRARNPWLGLVLDAVGAQIGRPVPPPGVPGPFSLADRDGLVRVLRDAELIDVEVEELAVPLRAATFEEWWTRTSTLAGPLATILAALSEDALQAIRTRLRTAVAAYRTPAGLELPGVTLLASARRTPVMS
jgi:SAM-dependent methyltransferase